MKANNLVLLCFLNLCFARFALGLALTSYQKTLNL